VELQALVSLFRRRLPVIVLAFVICVAGSAVLSRSHTKIYKSGTRLYVNVPGATNTRDQAEGVQLTSQLLASFAKVVDSQVTTRRVARELQTKITPAQIKAKVAAAPVLQTLLIDVTATDPDPVFAARLANAAGKALASVIDDLGASSSGGIKASIIDQASVPHTPVSPKPRRDIAVGGFLGLALGAAAALAIDALDRTIRQAEVAAAAFDAPVLCSIPRQRRISSDPLVALKSGGSSTGEAYRALRTAIRFRESSQHLKTVLVTSAAAGDGKSTIAANLAIAMSLDGAKVILIDADLRRTRLANMFDLPDGAGLTDVLLGKVALSDALVAWSRGLSILQVGTHTLNPSEALGSQAMVQVLEEAKRIADIVIVDAPPVLPVADPTVLAALVDGTVIVCRWGRTSTHAAESTRSMLDNVGADVIGVVLNAEGGGRSANYYRHYSTRPQHRREDRPAATALPSTSTNGAAAPDAELAPAVLTDEPESEPSLPPPDGS
jgi:receptor protein-tyrosine kinase